MMQKESNKNVIVVQWKRFAGTDIDVFSSLKGFCDSYRISCLFSRINIKMDFPHNLRRARYPMVFEKRQA